MRAVHCIALLAVAAVAACGDDTPTCPAGSENCPCLAGGTCGDGLSCQEGYCVPEACPAGSDGCPCYSNSTCDGELVCQAGTCHGTACTPGARGCPCDGTTCEGTLVCQDGVCLDPAGASVYVASAQVRSCDVLLDVGARPAVTMTFAGTVLGRARRVGSRLAFAFAARSDAPLTGSLASGASAAGQPVDLYGIVPAHVRCYDRYGVAVAEPGLTIE